MTNSNVENKLPAYMVEGSPYAEEWIRNEGNRESEEEEEEEIGQFNAHIAASHGDLEYLRHIADEQDDALHLKDINGWMPIHEGARSGHVEVLELLVEHGADIDARTNDGVGPTPLKIALMEHGSHHPVVDFLRSLGASIGPDL